MIGPAIGLVIAFLVVIFVLSRMGTQRKKAAIADLAREREALVTPDIIELVNDEVNETGIADLPGAADIDPVVLLKAWKRDGGPCAAGGYFSVADGVAPNEASETDVTFHCDRSDVDEDAT
jgi:hypothetical protein